MDNGDVNYCEEWQVEEMVEDFFRRPELWVVLKIRKGHLARKKEVPR